jgi:hypothetical protein
MARMKNVLKGDLTIPQHVWRNYLLEVGAKAYRGVWRRIPPFGEKFFLTAIA